ncbi:MAG: dihydroxyacetone kinase phosphoryl donor subunit DhaM [Lachnospiraceae bacterium]|nr:dihydroxyacetone kinase phosphoryl donor subunit DhaM [Lachnospiraceae bacterium]
MTGIVIVSHSRQLAEGAAELAGQMAGSAVIVAAGGLEDGSIGTDAFRIKEAIEKANDGDGVVILCDMGSAIMSAETALDFLEDSGVKAKIADAPVVEGAVSAAVTASTGAPMDEVIEAAEEARGQSKMS